MGYCLWPGRGVAQVSDPSGVATYALFGGEGVREGMWAGGKEASNKLTQDSQSCHTVVPLSPSSSTHTVQFTTKILSCRKIRGAPIVLINGSHPVHFPSLPPHNSPPPAHPIPYTPHIPPNQTQNNRGHYERLRLRRAGHGGLHLLGLVDVHAESAAGRRGATQDYGRAGV